MTELHRRDFVRGTACAVGAAALPEIEYARLREQVELEDWIGRALLARIYAGKHRLSADYADWELGDRYVEMRFERDGRLYASDPFRANIAALLSDHQPRFFSVRYYYDLALFNALVWNEHPAFRGLTGVAGNTLAWNAEEFTVQFLVAPAEQIVSEQGKHPEVQRWSRYFCTEKCQHILAAHCAAALAKT
jgi:hypothetical protein